jgi:glycine betaine/proline transport system substrate-binding protein
MIKDNKFGLKSFKMVESSEAGMLVEAQRAIRAKKAIVFLGWEPHPMNVQMKMKYLAGGDDIFGPNLGEAKVYTAVPPSYEAKCTNVMAFLKNLQFTTDMENQVMGPILQKTKPNTAARNFLKKNPGVLDAWLKGVKTFDGKDGLPVVQAALKR